MKRQRSEGPVATMGKKKVKREVEKKKEEEKRESRESWSGQTDTGSGLTHWEEYYYNGNWPWTCGFVDEQMSWGSVWLPIWDMDFMGEAFDALYSDVVWDDDIWNLRNQIPIPSERYREG